MTSGLAAADQALLEKHSPRLLIYPQEPGRRNRPGDKKGGTYGWGDYHPCSAEFFLSHVTWRKAGKAFSYNPINLLRFGPRRAESTGQPTPIEKIAARVNGAEDQNDTADWELDVTSLPSQAPTKAWEAYAKLLPAFEDTGGATVYGRVIDTWRGKTLQYWYLYLYNDFANKHEGDWEQVTIVLERDELPLTVGYSSHMSGNRRCWEHTPREGDHPILYVARGSHAGYYSYNGGRHSAELSFGGKTPRLLRPAVNAAGWGLRQLNRVRVLDQYTDYVPKHADETPDAKDQGTGAVPLLCPTLRPMPSSEPDKDDHHWWWMWMQSRWGSSHERVMGGSGPEPPWKVKTDNARWADPAAWVRTLSDDCPPH